VLELCERLIDGLRSRLTSICDVAEKRFEELVDINWATASRCPWIENYQQLPKLLVEIETIAIEIFKCVSKARSESNSVLISKKQPPVDEQEDAHYFITESETITSTAARFMRISFNSLKSLEIAENTTKSVDNENRLMKDRETSNKERAREEVQQKQKEILEKHLSAATSSATSKPMMIAITTSKLPGSGTDANPYVIIQGVKGKTVQIPLPDEDKSKFEAGNVDRFDIDISGDIGEIISITIGLSAHATDLNADWRISDLELVDKSGGKRYIFPIKDHITLGGFVHSKEKTLKL